MRSRDWPIVPYSLRKMKFDVYINTSCSVYDIDAKSEQEAQIKALKLMLKEARKKNPQGTEQVQNLEINYVLDSDDYYDMEANK